jgi:hypothetical protein
MGRRVELTVAVEDGVIVVTLPGTCFRATYLRKPRARKLCQEIYVHDENAPISCYELESLALRMAKEKAREVGWNISERKIGNEALAGKDGGLTIRRSPIR